jgi:hypothetical protein
MQQALCGGDEGKRQRTAEIMMEYMDRVERIGQRAETRNEKLDADQTQTAGPAESAEEMLRRVARDIYGVDRPAGVGSA